MKQISILGCGWLGLPLAKSLIEKGFSVNGSTTSVEKIAVLENAGIHSFLVSLSAVEVSNETKISIENFLQNSDVLIIDIPPKLRGDSSENFVAKIQNIIPFIENPFSNNDFAKGNPNQPQPKILMCFIIKA